MTATLTGMSATTGATLSGLEHLAQSIGDILGTPLGTRVMRRDYGSMLFDLIDHPLNSATRLLLFAATAIALRRWEPRLRVTRVSLSAPEALTPDEAAAALSQGQVALLIEGDRTDLPAANSRILLSAPIRAGGIAPVTLLAAS